ncbi:nucleotidyltransferase family protein [Promicromonospora aerolata]|uniref:NTP transferase domain-containing protein n=1 Tax=Promicromonospora aerolata TaxID=195749 RepID=A0ABW4V695_9MICO
MSGTRAVGLVLAAGAGTRYGMPKALARTDAGTSWLELACQALVGGGCGEVVVVLGARADEAAELVPADARRVVAPGWRSGIAASLRTGLAAAARTGAEVAVVSLVDLPDLRPDAARRVLDSVPQQGAHALARATYDGTPGHPVLVGRAHWQPLGAAVRQDTGAGPYLRTHGALAVDCTDLGGGDDVDQPDGRHSPQQTIKEGHHAHEPHRTRHRSQPGNG